MTVPWSTCRYEDEPCLGIQLESGLCLRHLPANMRPDTLTFRDFSGTRFDSELLTYVIQKVNSIFTRTSFTRAEFADDVSFDRIIFERDADFSHARFHGAASFANARFDGVAQFEAAQFTSDVIFTGAQFGGNAVFSATRVGGRLGLDGAAFSRVAWLGPLVADEVDLKGARFTARAEIIASAGRVHAKRTRFDDTAILRFRYAALSLEGANFGASSSISGSDQPFVSSRLGQVDEPDDQVRRWPDSPMPALVSLRDSEIGKLTITDVDLRWCQFAGARGLDQLRYGGACPLNIPPPGRARRAVLAEEHFWRAERHPASGWIPNHPLGEETSRVDPARLATLYRSLRKAFEDSKNEAGAGDFYYGEMEARRHSPVTRPAERGILFAYWLLSGYGQRALRALAALVVLLAVVTGILIGFGLPQPIEQQVTGTVQSGHAELAVREPAPVLPPAGQRWTGPRVEKAVQITLGAMVFRDAGQKLTPAGTWTVTVARIGGPLLLALAVLAIRARVKR